MENQFPNIEQYSNEELDYLIQAAIEILNAHKQSSTKNRCWMPIGA